ncbi:membrane hypothetical protein [Gammaproteobacteria bacterium]
MEFIETFLLAFWPAILGSQAGWSIVWLAIRSKSNMVLPFIGPKSFRELSSFSDDEQKRLLYETAKDAFGYWHWFIEFLLFPLAFSFAGVLGSSLLKIVLPGIPSWVSSYGAGALVGLSFWILIHLQMLYLRPLLKDRISKALHAS